MFALPGIFDRSTFVNTFCAMPVVVVYSSAIVRSKGGLSAGAATICAIIWSQPPTVSTFVPYFSLNGLTTASRKLSS